MKKTMLIFLSLFSLSLGAAVSPISFNSMAELRASPGGSFATAEVKRYYPDVDGGGQTLDWYATSSETPDSCTIFKPSNGGNLGRWKSRNISFIDAKSCGTKGDGVTNDRARLGSAIAAANAYGVALVIPRGTYFIDAGELTFSCETKVLAGALLTWTMTNHSVVFKHIDAGPYQIFSSFPDSRPPEYYSDYTGASKTWFAKWFASLAKACKALATGNNLYLHDGDYLVPATIDLSGKSFISIEGESVKGVRIIPTATLGTMFYFNNAELTVQREVHLSRLTFMSNNTYGICDYAIRAVWTPEFHIESCHFINVSAVYSVLFSTSFVATINNCIGIGHAANDNWGTGTPGASAGGGGFYSEQTATTLNMNTCRWSEYAVGVKLVSTDESFLTNNAIESNTTAGIEIDGASSNTTIQNNYFEGENLSGTADIRFVGTSYSTTILNNFFHGADRSIRFDSSFDVIGCKIQSNYFYSGSIGIEDRGAHPKQLVVENNSFRDMVNSVSLSYDSVESSRRLLFKNNIFSNAPTEILSDVRDLGHGSSVSTWSTTGSAIIAGNSRTYGADSVWRVYATGLDYASKTLFTIGSSTNLNLRGQWVTVNIPIITGSGAGPVARILDGAKTKNYILSAGTAWKQNTLYFKLDDTATVFTLRILPAGDSVFVGRPIVRLGLFDDLGGAEPSFAGFAVPSASSGLTAIAGTSESVMRADAAPAIDQSISPDWSSNHSFQKRISFSGTGTLVTAAVARTALDGLVMEGVSGSANDFGIYSAAGLLFMRNPTGTSNVVFLGTVAASNISGTNTGDQTITLTGDVTGSGTGSFAATIGANKVTLADMATVATASVLGRNTAATGNVEVLTTLPSGVQDNITRLGTIANVGASIGVAYGGTGAATLASNGVLYGQGTSAVLALAVNSTGTKKFLTQTSSAAPAWNTIAASDIQGLAPEWTQNISFDGNINFQANTTGGTASAWKSAANGVNIQGVTGSTYALALLTNGGAVALGISGSDILLPRLAGTGSRLMQVDNTGIPFASGALSGNLTLNSETFSNAAKSVTSGVMYEAQTGTMSASRVVTLPAASAYARGTLLVVADESGTTSAVNTLVITAAGSDKINGSATKTIGITGGYDVWVGMSDGTSKWTTITSL